MSKKLLLGAALPFLSNPVILAVVGVGAAGYVLYDIFCEKKDTEDNPDQPYVNKRLDQPLNTVQTTVNQTVHEPWNDPLATVEDTVSLTDEAAIKKEIIRQAMSELGKRSAAKRRLKKY